MDTEAIRAVIRDELAAALRKPKTGPKDPRPNLNCRFDPAEYDAIRAAAIARGITVSDLVRLALAPVIGRELRMHRETPANFRHTNNRKKARHYRDPATDDRAREDAAKRSVQLGIQARQAAIEAGAASLTAAHVAGGMLSDAAGRRSVPKLSR
jgi:hypothetical protein